MLFIFPLNPIITMKLYEKAKNYNSQHLIALKLNKDKKWFGGI